MAVFVNDAKKYEVLTDHSGSPLPPVSATVLNGHVVNFSGGSPVPSDVVTSLIVRKSGRSHFHATDDPALRSYNAVACDYAG